MESYSIQSTVSLVDLETEQGRKLSLLHSAELAAASWSPLTGAEMCETAITAGICGNTLTCPGHASLDFGYFQAVLEEENFFLFLESLLSSSPTNREN